VLSDTDLVREEIWESLTVSKGNREAFVSAHLSSNIGAQIFALRESRGWSQGELAAEVGMAQPRISILEGGYDNYSLRTLRRFASAFDVAVVVRFVPFSELVNWIAALAPSQLAPVDFANDYLSAQHDVNVYLEAMQATGSSALYSQGNLNYGALTSSGTPSLSFGVMPGATTYGQGITYLGNIGQDVAVPRLLFTGATQEHHFYAWNGTSQGGSSGSAGFNAQTAASAYLVGIGNFGINLSGPPTGFSVTASNTLPLLTGQEVAHVR
jgi:transcriptional regulator with XRE-family HTH domain